MTDTPPGTSDIDAGRDEAERSGGGCGAGTSTARESGRIAVMRRWLTTSRLGRSGTALTVALPYLAASGLALLAALWTYQPWKFGSAIANPSGDSLAFHAWIQNIAESGWYEVGPRLAAPFVQDNHAYSVTDDLLFAFVGKVLVPLTGSVGAAVTAAMVLSFPLAAAFAVGLARSLRISRVAAVLVGVAFALLPDHFLRGASGHVALAQTWVLPIGVLAATSLVHHAPWRGRRLRAREIAILVGCLSIGLVNAYYAVFVGILVAAAALGAWRLRGFRAAWPPALLRIVALALPVGVTLWLDARNSPSLLGFASIDITRSAADTDTYGGRILAMLLPSSVHRSELFRSVREQYDATFPPPAEGPSLGLVAAAGFLFLIGWAVLTLWSRAGSQRRPVLSTLAALTWVSVLAYSVGGLGQLWALVLGGGGIRAWSRMHVVIALLALLAVATLLDRLRRRPRLQFAGVAVLVVVVLLDQTIPLLRPTPQTAKAIQAEVTGLTEAIKGGLDTGAMVYQFPDVSFPLALRETSPASAYDGFLPFLYSSPHLRWSYGGHQGAPTADWQQALGQRPAGEQRELLTAAGFSGVLVDTATASSTPEDLAAARAAFGTPSIVSSSGRWEFYPLAAPTGACLSGEANLADAALRPPLLYPGDGFSPVGNVYLAEPGKGGTLRILTLRESGWPEAEVRFTIDAPSDGLQLTWPDGTTTDVAAGSQEVRWSGRIDAPEVLVDVDVTGVDRTPVLAHGFSADVLDGAAATCLTNADPPADGVPAGG